MNKTLTAKTITHDQIRSLRYEAREADDIVQVVLCDRALGVSVDYEDWRGGGWDYREMSRIREAASTSEADAIDACVDAINETAAAQSV